MRSRHSIPSFWSCFPSVTVRHRRALFHGSQAFVSARRAPQQNGAFHQRQSGWACRLSACLSVCCAAAQLPAAACPCLHEPGFCALVCCGWASFHVEPVVHSSLSKFWRGEICLSSGWKCVAQNQNYAPDCIKTCCLFVCLYLCLSDFQRKFCLCSSKVD